MKLAFRSLKAVIGALEFFQLRLLIGKGLRGADAGEPGLNICVDDGGLLLHPAGGLLHGGAALPHHDEKHRQNQCDDQGQPPLNGEHNGQSAHYRDT